uniref:Polyprotein n=1 Tax=Peronospora matthiolae TaxID=2874970 RepID=A0AAV1VMN5_9STRA
MKNGCISWRSKKQRTVALSSTEAEYMALTEATQEAVWLKAFLCEIGEMKNDEAVKIYKDDQGSIALAKNPESHKKNEAYLYPVSLRVREGCRRPSVATVLRYEEHESRPHDKADPRCAVRISSGHAGDQDTKVCRVEWECCKRYSSA